MARGFSAALATLCNQQPDFFEVDTGNGVQLDFMAAGATLLLMVVVSSGVRETSALVTGGWGLGPCRPHGWRGAAELACPRQPT